MSPRAISRNRYTSLLTRTRSPGCRVFSIDPDGMANTWTTNALTRMVRTSAAMTMTTRSRQKDRARFLPFGRPGARAGADECASAWASCGEAPCPTGLPGSGGDSGSDAPSEPSQRGSGAISDQPGSRRSAGAGLPALLDPRGLAAQVPQVVQLGPADTAAGDRLDLVDRGAVHREGTLDAHAVTHLAHGERLPQTTALASDHDTLEHLDPGAVTFLDPDVHLEGVTGAKVRDIVPDLGLLKLGDRGMHGGSFLNLGRMCALAHPGCKPAFARAAPRQSHRPNGQRSSVCHIFAVNRKAGGVEHFLVPCVEPVRDRREAADQVRPAARGAAQRLVPLPARYRRVVAGQQYRRDLMPPPGPRPGVDGSFQQSPHRAVTAAERVIRDRLLVAEYAGQQAAYRLHDHRHGSLAASEHIVADADLVHPDARRGIGDHPRVDSLVPAAGEHQMPLRRVGSGKILGKRHPARRRHHEPGYPPGSLRRVG